MILETRGLAGKVLKNLVGWVCIGDEKLPSYIGIIINHCKDPY